MSSLASIDDPHLGATTGLTLAIETSASLGSVAVFDAGRLQVEKTLELGSQHGQSLIPAIRDVLAEGGRKPRDVRLVAVSIGPGSFTGLRVGVVCAKTLAYATGAKLVAIDTLHAIACNSPPETEIVEVICDAHRGDLFAGKYVRNAEGGWAPPDNIRIISCEEWLGGLKPRDTVSGPALDKLAPQVEGRVRVLAAEFRVAHATWIGRLGIEAAEAGALADLAALEPLYLRRSSAEIQWEKLHPGR